MAETTRLDPSVRTLWMVGALAPSVVLVLVAVVLLIVGVPIAPIIVGGLAVLSGVLGAVYVPARWRAWGYALTETELFVRFGVIFTTQRWIPRTRVQYVDMIGGPIERTLGLRTLTIYTAGSRLANLSIPGLPEAVAERLRAELLSWSRDAAPDEPSEWPAPDGSPLVPVPVADGFAAPPSSPPGPHVTPPLPPLPGSQWDP